MSLKKILLEAKSEYKYPLSSKEIFDDKNFYKKLLKIDSGAAISIENAKNLYINFDKKENFDKIKKLIQDNFYVSIVPKGFENEQGEFVPQMLIGIMKNAKQYRK